MGAEARQRARQPPGPAAGQSHARANKSPLHYARALPTRQERRRALRAFIDVNLFVFSKVTSQLARGGSTRAAGSVQGRARGTAGGGEDARGGQRCPRCPPALPSTASLGACPVFPPLARFFSPYCPRRRHPHAEPKPLCCARSCHGERGPRSAPQTPRGTGTVWESRSCAPPTPSHPNLQLPWVPAGKLSLPSRRRGTAPAAKPRLLPPRGQEKALGASDEPLERESRGQSSDRGEKKGRNRSTQTGT